MSKYGVLVMGPAGAGKVCAALNLLKLIALIGHADNLLFSFDTTSEE